METGLIIRYKDEIDGDIIADALNASDYYYEWSGRRFFLKEEIFYYDFLEMELNKIIPREANYWIESI